VSVGVHNGSKNHLIHARRCSFGRFGESKFPKKRSNNQSGDLQPVVVITAYLSIRFAIEKGHRILVDLGK